MQAGPIPSKASDILVRAIKKASKKYGLGATWFNTSVQETINPVLLEQVVYRSLVQNDVVFSSEGLTIIAIDHAYALKAGLNDMENRRGSLLEQVLLLRRIVYISRGRPLTRGYIRRCYSGLETSDSMLLRLNAEYEQKYKARGVVGVNDEFMEWRREGLTWSAEMEEYRKELRTMIERDSTEHMCFSDENNRRASMPPTPGIPHGRCSEVANIFAGKKELFSAFAQ